MVSSIHGLPRVVVAVLVVLAALVSALAAAPRASAQAWTIEREVAPTLDGETLVAKRFRNPGGVPIVAFPGVGANAEEWDLPGRSVARFLADRGWDVWLFSNRGTGRAPFRSSGSGEDGFDDLALLDVDAAVTAVAAATGQRPFLLGHSQGGMLCLAWLQGVERRRVPVRREVRVLGGWPRVVDVYAERIEADAATARARNASVRGVVALASPARLAWPARATVLDYWRHSYWDYNIIVESLAWSPAANLAASLAPLVPAQDLVDLVVQDVARFPYVGPQVRPFLEQVMRQVGRSFLSAQLMKPGSVDPRVLVDALALAADDIPTRSLRQFLESTRRRDHLDEHAHDLLRAPYSYASNYHRISAPVLWIGGRFDKVANDDMIEAHVQRLGSSDRTFLGVPHGHLDLVFGDQAPADVWAPVEAWMAQRR